MSILKETSVGWIISHPKFLEETYLNTGEGENTKKYRYKKSLFEINESYDVKKNSKKRKRKVPELDKATLNVKSMYDAFHSENWSSCKSDPGEGNTAALEVAEECYNSTVDTNLSNSFGGNENSYPVSLNIQDNRYLFPANCSFYAKDIKDLNNWDGGDKFDVIVLDPPWWNKYIRRIKKVNKDRSYSMLYDTDLKNIPIEHLLSESGLVVVWCTNSETHLTAIKNDFFPKWNVKYLTTWFWLKVTKNGVPVCKFNEPFGKQPYEQIVIGHHVQNTKKLSAEEKIIISVPSALHSNKPPLVEILKKYTEDNAKCLEIFARYLIPNWTSWGLEVCRFQHESLFEEYT